jgi:hypothetical protein
MMAGKGTNTPGESCAQAYERNRNEIYGKIELLMKRLAETSVGCNDANWAHVGSQEHIKQLLDELLEFVG